MKILHVTEIPNGGTLTVLEQLAVDQTTRFGSGQVRLLIPNQALSDLHDVKPAQVSTYQRNGRNVGSLLRLLMAFAQEWWAFDPEIIHLHSSFAGVVCRALLMLVPFHRARVVYTPHAWAFMMDVSPTKRVVLVAIERILGWVTDRVICVSEAEKEEARTQGLPVSKMAVVHNGVPLPREEPDRRLDGPVRALFVGRISRQKGFDVLLDAIEGQRDLPVIKVVGDIDKIPAERAEASNLDLVGWVPRPEIGAFYRESDVLVVPSRWEGLPMVVLEAGSHGCAILATDIRIFREIVDDGSTGILVPNEDPAALARALRQTSAEEWRRLGQEMRKSVEQRFSLSQTCDRTVSVYETVAMRR